MQIASCALAVGLAIAGLGVQVKSPSLYVIAMTTLVGCGVGVANIAVINFVSQWNMARRGFANGYFGTALGLGAVFWTLVLSRMLDDMAPGKVFMITGAREGTPAPQHTNTHEHAAQSSA